MAAAGYEREIKLGAPPSFQLPDLDGIGGWSVETLPTQELVTTYFDTADLRLARWGCTLRYRVGEGWTVKVPAPSTGIVVTRHEHTFAGNEGEPPTAAVQALRAYIRRATLEAVLTLCTRRQRLALRAADGTPAAELVDDDVHVAAVGTSDVHGAMPSNAGAAFREIEIELAEGANAESLAAVLGNLRRAGAGEVDPTPKHIRALGARAAAPADVVVPEAGRKAAAGDIVRRALSRSVVILMQSDPGIRLGDDPEDVHQARVATRRLRSDLRTFGPLVDRGWRQGLRAELAWLAGELGTVRDLEVLRTGLQERLADLPPDDALAAAPLLDQLAAEEREARGRLLQTLDSARYLDLLERLIDAARAPALLPAAAQRASSALPALARRPWGELRQAVQQLPAEPEDAALHQIRLLAKRARYAAEAVAPVVGKPAERFAAAAAALQTVLGDHLDASQAQAWLRKQADGPNAFIAGALVMAERAKELGALAAWPAAWQSLDRRRLRRWFQAEERRHGSKRDRQ